MVKKLLKKSANSNLLYWAIEQHHFIGADTVLQRCSWGEWWENCWNYCRSSYHSGPMSKHSVTRKRNSRRMIEVEAEDRIWQMTQSDTSTQHSRGYCRVLQNRRLTSPWCHCFKHSYSSILLDKHSHWSCLQEPTRPSTHPWKASHWSCTQTNLQQFIMQLESKLWPGPRQAPLYILQTGSEFEKGRCGVTN